MFCKINYFLCFFLKYASFSPVCLIFLANKFANTIIFSTFAKISRATFLYTYVFRFLLYMYFNLMKNKFAGG